MKLASIDLGTNTCNLCIAEYLTSSNINVLYTDKQPIKLGAEGFPNGNIGEAAIERLLNVLKNYKNIIHNYHVDAHQIFATSGMRNAKNQQAIIDKIKSQTGFETFVISGIQEAEFIYQGVRQAVPMDETPQ